MPEERLDLLNGKVRIRQLPSDAVSTSDRFVTVNMTTGVLESRPITTLPDNCEWSFTGTGAGGLNVATAVGSTPGCPGDANNVGIGINNPSAAKLHVIRNPVLGEEVGIASNTYGDGATAYSHNRALAGIVQAASGVSGGEYHYGVKGVAEGASGNSPWGGNYGLHGVASGNASCRWKVGVHGYSSGGNSTSAVGVFGWTQAEATPIRAGVWGRAYVPDDYDPNTTSVYGVRGEIYFADSANQPNVWAGHFNHKVMVNGALHTNLTVVPSDSHLKSEVENLSGAMEHIMQLRPTTYRYRTEEFPQMHLPEGRRMGLIAQEVAEVYPELVVPSVVDALVDSTGEVLAPAVKYMGMNYTELIPLLIAGMQEQNTRIAELEERLAVCCSNRDGYTRSMPVDPAGATEGGNDRRLMIQPNPFNEATTVSYTLERAGRMQLLVNSADGKQLNVLEEAQRAAGDYRYEWNTSALKAGMYYVTLLLDGQPVVKKAVKVAR